MRLGLAVSLLLCLSAEAAVSHRHVGQHEREADGAFSPRDKHHLEDDEHDDQFDHEAILGSHKDAEEFDDLEPEEAKQRLGVLLEKMDKDGDKQISREELKQWILRSFKLLSEEESAERWEEVDEDSDDQITWKEYAAETYGSKDDDDDDELSADDKEEEDKLMSEDRRLFLAADRDGDGALQRSEFLSFSHPEEDPRMIPVVVDHTLLEKDLDKDGYISFQEFVGEQAKDKDQAWLEAEKDKFDSDYDKDRDGRLDRDEVQAWVLPSNTEIADDEVDHLFASADDDVDDALSFQEVLEHHDVFVGSEATDYGEHLTNLHKFDDEL
ncbi:reticulocalbin-2-like [Pollicipes pollicipes]|uniref:reticulocalbin-2-like n=1 Tax=Pollicipes pollicipes TaxID=41117 RepID=UPI0018859F98|nr:reticulocalbin-2-like [Pollicipes pollicipes]XP_037085982.1 reticulocalbin-2-like [Pollicipes pollicipes]